MPVSAEPEPRQSVLAVEFDTPNQQPAKEQGAFRAVAPTSGATTSEVPRRVYIKHKLLA
jgi:hypothetical protein